VRGARHAASFGAPVAAAGLGGECRDAGGGVFFVAPLHFLQRGPDRAQELAEGRIVKGESGCSDAGRVRATIAAGMSAGFAGWFSASSAKGRT